MVRTLNQIEAAYSRVLFYVAELIGGIRLVWGREDGGLALWQ
jgi:hypothetical protein